MTHDPNPTLVSDRQLKLLLIDDDPIFRLGLRVFVEQFPDLQVVAEADRATTALQILENGQTSIGLVILDLGLGRLAVGSRSGLELCQQLKTQYPNLPVLLLSAFSESVQLEAVRQAGVEGYCPKGTPVSELVQAIRQVAAGQPYWQPVRREERGVMNREQGSNFSPRSQAGPLAVFRDRLYLSALGQIDAVLAQVTAQLQNTGLSPLDRAIVAGQRRELLASRWLVNWLLAPRVTVPVGDSGSRETEGLVSRLRRERDSTERSAERSRRSRSPNVSAEREAGEQGRISPALPPPSSTSEDSELSVTTWQSTLFDNTFAKIHYGVQNLTDVPLEIDIFKEEKKRELLHLILQKLEDILEELRFSKVQPEQMIQKRSNILQDLWQAATTDFFGKYYTVQLGYEQIEIVQVLLQDALIVEKEILDKIPLVVELFNHFLFQTSLLIDNVFYSEGTPEAMARSELILQNLIIQVANAVVQPLLNRFADLEIVKHNFYDQKLISTREVEGFRNNLSWKYRVDNYIGEPTAIFESRYVLFVFNGRGIRKTFIYAPRGQELQQLSGVQQAVTLLLEARDAIAPRLRSVVAFVGRGVVYVLTQVIGRAIGLVGRGIIQGIGSSLQDNPFRNNDNKQK